MGDIGGSTILGSGGISSAPPQQNMGLGVIGANGIVFKRRFRWSLEIDYCTTGSTKSVPREFVKVAARPQIDIEETEINYLHGKFWIPGKGTWQTMTVTYYDVSANSTFFNSPPLGDTAMTINGLLGWIASVYDITNPTTLYMGSKLQDYQGLARIFLYDGCGNALEGWLLQNVWPQAINFGELDMSSSDECTIELTLRYSQVSYQSYCPAGSIVKCPCTPCASNP